MNFDEWIKFVFDRPVANPAWYWHDEEFDSTPDLEPARFIDYGTRLFNNSAELLKPFSDAQINDGLYLLISNNCSDQIFAIKNQNTPLEARLDFLNGIFALNRDCFDPRCTPHLSHLDRSETPAHVSRLNSICYMWWDIFIIFGDRDDKSLEPLNKMCLSVMDRSLTLSNIAVLEGALHGLGHFANYYKETSANIIDRFLHSSRTLPEPLLNYARGARTGGVL
ncbi:MAG TPA: hypothetical protein VF773_00200 [Verrucomicrobiae bacterium]